MYLALFRPKTSWALPPGDTVGKRSRTIKKVNKSELEATLSHLYTGGGAALQSDNVASIGSDSLQNRAFVLPIHSRFKQPQLLRFMGFWEWFR